MRTGYRLTLAMLLLPACPSQPSQPSSQTDASPIATCGPNLTPYKSACIPILDDCPGNQVPLPGGGCQRIGVEECTVDSRPGLRGPPDWSCQPVGPPLPCNAGWTQGADGLCEPVLPTSPCAADTMEVIGEAACQPVGDCTAAPVTTPGTLFVDAAFTGAGADGSEAKPFPTIGQALKASPASGHVVVAAGTYAEDLTIDKPLRLEGRCAAQVAVLGQAAAAAVTVDSTGVELSGLRVTGPGLGVEVLEDAALTLTDVVVRDCGDSGVRSRPRATLAVTDSLLADNVANGILALDAELRVDRSVVRGSRTAQEARFGGVVVAGLFTTPEVALRRSLISGNAIYSVAVSDGSLTVEDTVVRDTVPPTEAEAEALCKTLPPEQQPPDCVAAYQNLGYGILVFGGQMGPTSLTLRRTLVRNSPQGVALHRAPATIEESIIRDGEQVTPTTSLAVSGLLVGTDVAGTEPTVTMKDSAVTGNAPFGILVAGGRLALERTVVEKTGGSYWTPGEGIHVQDTNGVVVTSTLELRDSLVRANQGSGIMLAGASLTLERSAVVDGQATELSQLNGIGIGATAGIQSASRLVLKDSLIARNRVAGVDVNDSAADLVRTVIRDTRDELLTGRFGRGLRSSYQLRHRPSLLLRQSLIQESRATGLELLGTETLVEGSVIRSTQPNKSDGLWGEGIYATLAHDTPTRLTLTDSVVTGSHTTGLLLLSSSATVERSVIEDTRAEAGSGSFGDGIAVGPAVLGKPATLVLSDSLVQDSARAGLAFFGGTGRVRRSLIRRGTLGVALERGADPDLGPCNVYEDNSENRLSFDLNLAGPGPIGLPPAP